MRQKMNASINSEDKDGKIILSLKHTLDPGLYNFPLTLKTRVNEDWKSVTIKQGAKTVTLQTSSDTEGAFVLYEALPNSDDIEIFQTK